MKCEVTDSGIGMSKIACDNIFKAFHQGDTSTTRKYGGTGLGLSICLKLVDLMNGKIRVKSEEGKGTTFSFELELKKSDIDEIQEKTQALEVPHLSDYTILICEDNKTNSKILSKVLSKTGCDMDFAF